MNFFLGQFISGRLLNRDILIAALEQLLDDAKAENEATEQYPPSVWIE